MSEQILWNYICTYFKCQKLEGNWIRSGWYWILAHF